MMVSGLICCCCCCCCCLQTNWVSSLVLNFVLLLRLLPLCLAASVAWC
jgi:hypothetical protein